MPWTAPLPPPFADAGALSVASAIQLSVCVASVGFAVSILEDLAAYAEYREDGLLSWRVARLRGRWTGDGRLAAPLDRLLGTAGYRWLLLAGLGAAALVPASTFRPTLLLPLVSVLLAVVLLCGVRNLYGTDGSDQMNLLLFASVTLYLVVPEGSVAQQACLWFLGVQVCLSYVVAGVAKLASPAWRSGGALVGVLSTRCYGHDRMYEVLRRHPRLALSACWGVMLFEVAFPLVFVVPPAYAAGLLALGAAFHLGCAVLLGLNNFLFAFVATYPLLWVLAQRTP